MPAEDDIVQRIVLEGDKEAIAQFGAVGKAGEAAFAKVGVAATATGKAFGSAGAGFASVLGGLRQTGHDSEEAAKGLDNAAQKGTNFATTLRLLGRATGTRELSRLGRTLGVLGRAFTIAAPAILAVGLEKIAEAGATAADKFADFAGTLKISTPELAQLEQIGTAAGVGFDDMGKSLTAVNDITKTTAENTTKNAETFRRLKDQLLDTQTAGDQLGEGFRRIGTEGRNAFRDFSRTIRDLGQQSLDTARDFVIGLRNIQEQRDSIKNGPVDANTAKQRQLRDLDEQEAKLKEQHALQEQKNLEAVIKAQQDYADGVAKRRAEVAKLNAELDKNFRTEQETRRAMSLARIEAEQNATALEKLGINALTSSGKLKKAPEVLNDIADALKNVRDPAERDKIELELVAAGIDRKLLPALRTGAAGLKAFQEAGKNINPQFTPAQVAIADKFALSMAQAGEAVSALIQQMGIAIAPALIPFFDKVRDILVEIRPGMIEFGKTLASVVGPALLGIAQVLQSVIIPAFQIFFGILNQLTGGRGVQVLVGALVLLGIAFGGVPTAIAAIIVGLGLLINSLKNAGVNFTGLATFATNTWNTIVAGVSSVVGMIVSAFTGLASFLSTIWAGISSASSTVWTAVTSAAQSAVSFITTLWTDFVSGLTNIWNGLVAIATAVWIGISNQAQIAADFVVGLFNIVKEKIVAVWTAIGDAIKATWDRVKDFVGKLLGAQGGGAQGGAATAPKALAMGGHIRGPGTGTSDSIPIWASHGEFMQPFAAVKKYGLGFMEAIRTLRFDPSGFNVGGLVSFKSPQPKLGFADGGLIGGGNTLNLSIDGQTFKGLRATDDTMDSLQKFATSRSLRSAGRKPTWFRG